MKNQGGLMKNQGYRVAPVLLLVFLLAAGTATAQVVQDIVVDGTNDFNVLNLVEDDIGDTQVTEIDLGEIYVTNNAVNLFVGYEFDKGTWGGNQIGIAIDVGTAAGGTTDPWSRQIEWSGAVNKPDFIVYCNIDNNWQAGYQWDGAAWVEFVPQGPGTLNWVTNTTFGELGLLLGTLGITTGTQVGVEIWTTQNSGARGALDMAANDAVQNSTLTATDWAPVTPVAATLLHSFTILSASDIDPPVVQAVTPTSHPIGTGLDVVFNEPVDQTTAETVGNYTLLDPVGTPIAVSSANLDGSAPNIVHLVLGTALTAADALYDLTVANVEDGAGNAIATGSGDQVCFMVKKLVFRGLFSFYLQNNSSPPDEFSIEGDLAPVTFGTLCDTGNMVDTGTDDIWEYSGLFLVTGNCGANTATADLQWKFAYNCATYEPLASNRVHTLDLAAGAVDTLEFWWNNDDPTNFLVAPMDVEYFVDMSGSGYAPGDTVGINGNVAPLTNGLPSVTELVDDGTGNDAVAGDGIFSTRVRFEVGAAKNVLYKFLLGSTYECFGQTDRHVYLNDAVFDTVGGTLGPLVLPAARWDRCSTTWAPVEVVFSVNFKHTEWHDITGADVVTLNGTASNTTPSVFNWDVPSLNVMADDGIYPDAAAGDWIYTCSVVFPDSSTQFTEYKFLVNDVYECILSNRGFWIDPDGFDAAGNPQILGTDRWGSCDVSGVPGAAVSLSLHQNWPNPFNPQTTISFDLPAAGHASLRIYNARGALVRTLKDERLAAGPHTVVWDGRSNQDGAVASGVYFYRLDASDEVQTRRMMLLK